MALPDPLRGVYLKLDHADKHLRTLNDEIARYLSDRPYIPVIQDQSRLEEACSWWPASLPGEDTSESFTRVLASEVRPIPDVVPLIVGDILHNLRSSLDHLAWQLVDRHAQLGRRGGRPRPNKKTQFPIQTERPSQCEHGNLPPLLQPMTTKGIEAALDALQPYNRQVPGDDSLAIINRYNIRDKHQTLNVVLSMAQDAQLAFTYPDGHVARQPCYVFFERTDADPPWGPSRMEEDAVLGYLRWQDAIPRLKQTPGKVHVDCDATLVVTLDRPVMHGSHVVSISKQLQSLIDYVRTTVVPRFVALRR